jgi:hypothetical protein
MNGENIGRSKPDSLAVKCADSSSSALTTYRLFIHTPAYSGGVGKRLQKFVGF